MPSDPIFPELTGERISRTELKRVTRLIKRYTKDFSLFDGYMDLNSHLLDIFVGKPKEPVTWIIDELTPDYGDRLIRSKRPLLFYVQYFEAGRLNLLSAYGTITATTKKGGYPALQMVTRGEILRTTSLLARLGDSYKNKFLELRFEEDDVRLRMLDMGSKSFRSIMETAKLLQAKADTISGQKLQFFDIESGLDNFEEEIDDSESFSSFGKNYLDEGFEDEGFDDEGFDSPDDVSFDDPDDESWIDETLPRIEMESNETQDLNLRALLAIHDPETGTYWIEMLNKLGIKADSVREHVLLNEKITDNEYDLIILDGMQEEVESHALDVIHIVREPGSYRRIPAVIIGDSLEASEPDNWTEKDRIIFARPKSPVEWVRFKLGNWFPDVLDFKPVEQILESMDIPDTSDMVIPPSEESSLMTEPLDTIGTLLIADEDPSDYKALSELFSIQGYKHDFALDGFSALELVRQDPPDILIMEIDLPKMNGIGVLRAIRQNPKIKDVPVIVYTKNTHTPFVNEVAKLGISKYLIKPVDPENLLKVISEIIEES